MNIKDRLNRCCGKYFAPAIKCEEGSRCSDCFDKLEGWREIERLRELLLTIRQSSNEEKIRTMANKYKDGN